MARSFLLVCCTPCLMPPHFSVLICYRRIYHFVCFVWEAKNNVWYTLNISLRTFLLKIVVNTGCAEASRGCTNVKLSSLHSGVKSSNSFGVLIPMIHICH